MRDRPPAALAAVFAILAFSPLDLRAQAEPAAPPDRAGPAADRIAVGVDPRVELLSLIFRLAGNPEYNQKASASPYAREVEEKFRPFADHAAVAAARRLRSTRGVSFDAVMGFAVHLESLPDLKERVPFDPRPESLDSRWSSEEARAFRDQLRQFVTDSGFEAFVAAHQEFYAQAAARLREPVRRRPFLDWFDRFFGARPKATYRVIAGLLNGGGNYGVHVDLGGRREEITPVIGAPEWDAGGLPVFGDDVLPLLVHEFGHPYTNPLVDRFTDDLSEPGRRIYARCAAIMQRQAYGNWRTMLCESLVRASVARFMLSDGGDAAFRRQVAEEHRRGFVWIGRLAEELGRYEADRQRWPDLEAFMPEIAGFFAQYAEDYEARMARVPKVVSIIPSNGETDVDPKLATLTIAFDRPMKAGSWSICGEPGDQPTLGTPSYDADRRVLTVPIKLGPGKTYRFWLNSERSKGFVSEEGLPLEPLPVTFTTRTE